MLGHAIFNVGLVPTSSQIPGVKAYYDFENKKAPIHFVLKTFTSVRDIEEENTNEIREIFSDPHKFALYCGVLLRENFEKWQLPEGTLTVVNETDDIHLTGFAFVLSANPNKETLQTFRRLVIYDKKRFYQSFTEDQWFDIARMIDGEFNGTRDTFTATRSLNEFWTLTTNQTDSASVIRFHYKTEHFERVGPDTEGYQTIHHGTSLRIREHIKSLYK